MITHNHRQPNRQQTPLKSIPLQRRIRDWQTNIRLAQHAVLGRDRIAGRNTRNQPAWQHHIQ
jgi:hypothetical protein